MIQINVEQFAQQGFYVAKQWLTSKTLKELKVEVQRQIKLNSSPLELESDVGYPGSPINHQVDGGQTTRRLLQAFDRGFIFQKIATAPAMRLTMQQLLNCKQVMLSRCHHNCIMTKSPQYSSHTGWHQDYRYWQFTNDNLVSAWVALGDEHAENGGMSLIPSSQKQDFASDDFDQQQFFKANQAHHSLIKKAVSIQLQAGDVLFFHANTLHCAGRNLTQDTKLALVFTYHAQHNQPVAHSRSARLSSISLNLAGK